MPIEIPIAGGTRALSRELSPAMQVVAKAQPNIFEPQRGGICAYSPVNFLGSLILSIYKPQNIKDLEKAGIPVPRSVTEPVEVIERVPISVYRAAKDDYTQTELRAESVLFKRGSGLGVGVVLTGETAGLLLRPKTRTELQDGMCVNRIWNDDLAEGRFPYRPGFALEVERGPVLMSGAEDVVYREVGERNRIALALNMRMRMGYDAVVNGAKREIGREPYESDVLFYLCDRMGIQVDKENFHTTRPSKQSA